MPAQSSTARVIRLDEHRAGAGRPAPAPPPLADENRKGGESRIFLAALAGSALFHVLLLFAANLSHHLIHHDTVPPKVLEVSLPEPPRPEPAAVPTPPKRPEPPKPQRAEPAPRAPVPAQASPAPTPVMAVPESAPAQPVTVAPPVERRPEPPPPPVAAPVTAPMFNAAYLRNPPPAYPMTARRLGQQGLVLLEVYVGTDGRAEQVKLGKTSGHAALDEAAISAVRGWTFVPAKRGAEPVAAWVEVPVRFRLDGGD